MTLQELSYAVAVAEHRHFGRAAAACHVSQPSLSAGLKRLEEELGVALFERGRSGVLPTREGEPLLTQARRVLDAAERMRELARRELAPLSGVFRLGVIPTVGPYLLPHVVPGLREGFADLRLHLREEQTARLLESLHEGTLDAALLSPPVEERGLARADLYREEFLAALPFDHPLARRRRLRSQDLLPEPLLLLDEGHCFREQSLEVCSSPGTPVRELLRGSSLETLRSMVAAGVGITLLPALAAPGEEGPVVVRPFRRPAPHRTISLYWRRGFAREPSARILGEEIRRRLPAGVRALRS
jgi:LysR family hydrogen peroxide-inducible transcriptional activator